MFEQCVTPTIILPVAHADLAEKAISVQAVEIVVEKTLARAVMFLANDFEIFVTRQNVH